MVQASLPEHIACLDGWGKGNRCPHLEVPKSCERGMPWIGKCKRGVWREFITLLDLPEFCKARGM